ncbi:mechanosensitive ion channel family protein [Saccharicrinis sp. FJH62]|uniref:mechanosensitive ion channel family protein n=1 Tax=Saccharicrinis sp. FJH62 TaxID=3344657 RepID=UPI0035D458F9
MVHLLEEIRSWLDTVLLTGKDYTITISNLLIALVIILITLLALNLIKKGFRRYFKKKTPQEASSFYSVFLIIKYFIWVIVIILILDSFHVKISVFLASFAALLVGVGLGIQQVFGDVAAGIILLFERNLRINDVIQLDDGTVGKVTEIGLRTSKIKTRDDIVTIVPNSKFVNDKIINWSHIDFKTRFNVGVGVAYGSNVELVTKILLDCADQVKLIANTPKPFVRFENFGDSSLDFKVYFWVSDSFHVENVKSQMRYNIDREFRAHKVTIPFPQRDVHFFNPAANEK